VWRETGYKRKENFYASCFGKLSFARTFPFTPESLNPNLHFVIQKKFFYATTNTIPKKDILNSYKYLKNNILS